MPNSVLQQIESDIAESGAADHGTATGKLPQEKALERIDQERAARLGHGQGWMLLQDQRRKAVDADLKAMPPANPEPPSVSKVR